MQSKKLTKNYIKYSNNTKSEMMNISNTKNPKLTKFSTYKLLFNNI